MLGRQKPQIRLVKRLEVWPRGQASGAHCRCRWRGGGGDVTCDEKYEISCERAGEQWGPRLDHAAKKLRQVEGKRTITGLQSARCWRS